MIPVCPKCDAALLILNFKDLEVDFCEKCRGIWLDAGELEALMQRTGARADDPLLEFQQQAGTVPTDKKYLCPRCDESMRQVVAQGTGRGPLTLERCPRGHGLWFDAGELRQLLAMFPADAGAGRTVEFLNEMFGVTPKT